MIDHPIPPNARAQRTRAALLAAGFELLAERPIDAIAIDDIVARAGVAKGSFFNHFDGKPGFGEAIGAEIRAELEARIGAANAGVADPLERLSGGMLHVAAYALEQPCKTAIMLYSRGQSTMRGDPVNQGVMADLDAVRAAGLLRPEAETSGVRYWLGLCRVLVLNLIERQPGREEAAERLREMLILALAGLGVPEARARETAEAVSARLSAPQSAT
jgi:AcrR family transcriptional regulator